jgi:release factor glutamine methyltransferase
VNLRRAALTLPTFSQWRLNQQHLSRLESDLLIAHVTKMSRAQILARPEQQLDKAQALKLDQLSLALCDGTPLAYVLGEKEFFGLSLRVNSSVLVPRPETELLVEKALQQLNPADKVLDAGTGSGAIAIALATNTLKLQVAASDNSKEALTIAAENAQRHDVAIDFYLSDWFKSLPDTRWNVIVSNPPYIAPNDPHLDALTAEPTAALIAQDNGLADLLTIIEESPKFLQSGGWLMLEHGYDQATAVRSAMLKRGFSEVESVTDLGEIERVTQGCYCE